MEKGGWKGWNKGLVLFCFFKQIFLILLCAPLHILFGKNRKEKEKKRKRGRNSVEISNKANHQFFKHPYQRFMAYDYQFEVLILFRL